MNRKIAFTFLVLCMTALSTSVFAISKQGPYLIYLEQSAEHETTVVDVVDGLNTNTSDYVFITNAIAEFSLMPKSESDFDFRVNYSFLQMLYNDVKENDFQYNNPSAKLQWFFSEDSVVEAQGGYTFTRLDDKALYDGAFGAGRLMHDFSDIARLYVKYKFEKYNYDQDFRKDRDADRHTTSVKYRYKFIPGTLHASAALTGKFNRAKDDGYSYDQFEGRIKLDAYSWLIEKLDWAFAIKYYNRGYDSVYPSYTKTRDDNRFNASVEVTYPIYKEIVSLGAKLEYEDNNSNIDDFDFDNVIAGINVSVMFI